MMKMVGWAKEEVDVEGKRWRERWDVGDWSDMGRVGWELLVKSRQATK